LNLKGFSIDEATTSVTGQAGAVVSRWGRQGAAP
jgi:hypothetical protein